MSVSRFYVSVEWQIGVVSTLVHSSIQCEVLDIVSSSVVDLETIISGCYVIWMVFALFHLWYASVLLVFNFGYNT